MMKVLWILPNNILFMGWAFLSILVKFLERQVLFPPDQHIPFAFDLGLQLFWRPWILLILLRIPGIYSTKLFNQILI